MRTDRLMMLANHLDTLDPRLWYFPQVVKSVESCGTVGCALGHCPDLWPESWAIARYGDFVTVDLTVDNLIHVGNYSARHGAELFFELDYKVVAELFFNVGQVYGDDEAMLHVTAKDVADRIRSIVRVETKRKIALVREVLRRKSLATTYETRRLVRPMARRANGRRTRICV